MKISVAIPTWECHGKGDYYLRDLFYSLTKQTFKEFEVCVSDHSKNNKILSVCEEYSDLLDIKYYKNSDDRGNSPANTNSAIEMCSADIIKVMFQDDFFYSNEALGKIVKLFDENLDDYWVLCGTNHTQDDGNSFYGNLIPQWNDNIINGVNTISSPSVLSIRKEVFDKIQFDKNLVMMMDCEFYHHAKEIFGEPIYCKEILVCNRVHENQISSNYLKEDYQEKFDNELLYCREKHKIN